MSYIKAIVVFSVFDEGSACKKNGFRKNSLECLFREFKLDLEMEDALSLEIKKY